MPNLSSMKEFADQLPLSFGAKVVETPTLGRPATRCVAPGVFEVNGKMQTRFTAPDLVPQYTYEITPWTPGNMPEIPPMMKISILCANGTRDIGPACGYTWSLTGDGWDIVAWEACA